MNHQTHWRTVAEMVVALTLAVPALSATAQQEPQSGEQMEPPPAQQQPGEGGDVPGRVARLNYFDGTVTFEPAGGNEWAYAELNRPMTTGDQVWVDNGGRSELHIGSTALRLGQQSALSIVNLDDQNAQLKLAQGSLTTRLRNLPAGQSFEVDTPNVALQADAPGDYRVDAAPDGASTTVTVREGSLTAFGDSGSVQIGPGQQLTFSGTSLQETGGGAAPPPDTFEAWAVSRDRAEDASVSAQYVSRDVPGYEDLDANGTWEASPDYGQVWVPRVAAGWAPYHEGHWAWVAPWGWTWVDDAPWGFAPFHYGRWAYYRNNWAWVPGPVVATAPPCYAPALVAFVGGGGGGGPGWGVSLTVGAVAAGVAWLPLGPGEPWRPAYRYSPRYYDRVNYVNHTTNVNNVHNTYINRGAPRAITGMPANQFVRGQGAGRFGQTLQPQQIAHNSVGAGAPGIAPVQQSFDGALRRATSRPPQTAVRPVIATRGAPTPFAYRDTLAQSFAKSGGRVQGAGQPVVRTAAPANFARLANAPGEPARNAAQPAFRVVPAERRPMPAQAQANRGAPAGNPAGGATREGQAALQPGQRPGQPEAGQRRDPQQTQGEIRPGQQPQVQGGERPGQPQANEINGARQPGQPVRPGEAPQQAQALRENGVPRPPDRAQAGRPGEQPGNVPAQAGQEGQQAEQQRAQQQQVEQQQRSQQAEQQRAQQQGQQPQAQEAQQRTQQQSQQQAVQRQQQQAQEAQQRTQQQSQQQAVQRQQQQAQEAQQRTQQQSQQQAVQRQQQQAQEAQQRMHQQSQQQAVQRQQQQAQEAQQRMQQQSQQQAVQRQQQQAQEAQQRMQQQSQQVQQRQQQMQMQNQQRQQQQQQQERRAEPPAREPQRDAQHPG
jgi:hypothetical protein